LSSLSYSFNARQRSERWNDLAISTLTGFNRISDGDVRLPLRNTYSAINWVSATVIDSRPGIWTVSFIDKNPSGPRLQVRLGDTLTDPEFIDAYIQGN
jgi:hypothetical protein